MVESIVKSPARDKQQLSAGRETDRRRTESIPRETAEGRNHADRLLERTGESIESCCAATRSAMARELSALSEAVEQLNERLSAIGQVVAEIHESVTNQVPRKEWYTVGEVAEALGKAEFTVREWCRLGRVYASKRACGRGNSQEWIVADTEIERIRNEGLLPM